MEDELHFAVKAKDIEKVRELITAGAPVNALGKSNEFLNVTPLQTAIFNKNAEITKLLLESGANPNLHHENFISPLLLSVRTGFDPGLKLLVEHGVDVSGVDNEGNNALHAYIFGLGGFLSNHTFNRDEEKENIKRRLLYLKEIGVDFSKKNHKGKSAFEVADDIQKNWSSGSTMVLLQYVSKHEKKLHNDKIELFEYLKELLSSSMSYNDASERFENYLLDAVQTGNVEKVDQLLKAGVPLLAKDRRFIKTPLLNVAIEKKQKAVIQYLFDKGIAVDEVDPGDLEKVKSDAKFSIFRPIHLAIENKDIPLIDALLQRGASLIQAFGEHSVLLSAIVASDDGVVLNKLIDAGAEVNPAYASKIPETTVEKARAITTKRYPETIFYPTPLIVAITLQRMNSLRILLQRGADPNLRIPYGNATLFSFLDGKGTAAQALLDFPGTDLYAINSTPDMGEGSMVDYSNNGKISRSWAYMVLDKVGPFWRGFSRSDIANLNSIFSPDSKERNDFSLCPVCLKFSHRVDGCMYMNHNCEEEAGGGYYDKYLYNKFKTAEGRIYWCTICGRIALGHRHYRIDGYNWERPELLPPRPGGQDPFEDDCSRTNGGGGPLEKYIRYDALRIEARKLLDKIGSISEMHAKDNLTLYMWNAPAFNWYNRATRTEEYRTPYAERRHIAPITNFPETLPRIVPPPVRTIPRALRNRELMPELHPASKGLINSYMGAPSEVIQFHHRKKDGTINDHVGSYISKEGLEVFLEGVIASKGERLGYCWEPQCSAIMHPDEVRPFVDEELYTRYLEAFNRKFSGAEGGGKKTRRKQRGGSGATKPTANSVFQEVKYPQCYLPKNKSNKAKTMRRRKLRRSKIGN